MTDTSPSKPPARAGKSEKTLLELSGVFKVGLVSEEKPSRPQPIQHVPTDALASIALISAVILYGMFLTLGRRKRRP